MLRKIIDFSIFTLKKNSLNRILQIEFIKNKSMNGKVLEFGTSKNSSKKFSNFTKNTENTEFYFADQNFKENQLDDALIKNENGKIKSFKSHCGGLIHPKYDNNTWNSKFTWNPRNVVLAAKGQAKFLRNNKIVQVNYPDVFDQTEKIYIDQLGDFDSYANRDSLKYIKLYGLDEIDTMFRGTLRRKGFCESWEIIALLGLTDDEVYLNTFNKSYKDLILSQLFNKDNVIDLKKEIELKVSRKISEETYNKLLWTELFTCNRKLKNEKMTLAQVVESLLVKKWNFEEKDRDMIVMQHDFEYQKNNRLLNKKSTLVVYGDENFSAMSKTVGLPLAIATKLILENKINYYGVKIPDISMIYEPILKELEDYKINFNESVVEV